ncbi:ORF1 [Ranid herpesvirus 1]|uniref:ORF1 n=1 Tax=Ranid herpesvirus 1 TaxID=85655 RepID=Q14VV7_9VIRU|nr:ORF1 [Ranid herpesvirus 1]ABG25806.1 ORF1 [Ranid herpesvirus 1]
MCAQSAESSRLGWMPTWITYTQEDGLQDPWFYIAKAVRSAVTVNRLLDVFLRLEGHTPYYKAVLDMVMVERTAAAKRTIILNAIETEPHQRACDMFSTVCRECFRVQPQLAQIVFLEMNNIKPANRYEIEYTVLELYAAHGYLFGHPMFLEKPICAQIKRLPALYPQYPYLIRAIVWHQICYYAISLEKYMPLKDHLRNAWIRRGNSRSSFDESHALALYVKKHYTLEKQRALGTLLAYGLGVLCSAADSGSMSIVSIYKAFFNHEFFAPTRVYRLDPNRKNGRVRFAPALQRILDHWSNNKRACAKQFHIADYAMPKLCLEAQ